MMKEVASKIPVRNRTGLKRVRPAKQMMLPTVTKKMNMGHLFPLNHSQIALSYPFWHPY